MKNIKYFLGAALICAILFAVNVCATSAFPKSDAGISAYVNVSQSIDIEKVKSVFYEVEKVGDNYIYGKVNITEDTGGSITVHVYADTDGWLVAYLKSDEPVSRIMLWKTSDLNNPTFTVRTTLMEALTQAANKAQVSFAPAEVKYYDFKYPNANGMVILLKTQATEGNSIMQFQIPSNYTLYEASYYHYIYYYSYYSSDYYSHYRYWDSKMWVDETQISDLPTYYAGDVVYTGLYNTSSYGSSVEVGKLHAIKISYEKTSSESADHGSAGVAVVLVYKKI